MSYAGQTSIASACVTYWMSNVLQSLHLVDMQASNMRTRGVVSSSPGQLQLLHRARQKPCLAAARNTASTATYAPELMSTTGKALTAEDNYAHLCSNMGECTRPVSGYAGRWSRYQGASLDKVLGDGDIIYGFRPKQDQPEVTQVWKAEEGDLNSPKLQSQRATLPQLQKDPLQLQLDMDTLVVEVSAEAPLVEPSFASIPTSKLPATLKTLAVPNTGNLVVTGALPTITGANGDSAGQQAEIKGHPEAAKSWFNRLYLRVPGEEPGCSSRWSVMVHYDTETGDLLTHYHTWEAGIHPEPSSLQQVFTPGAHDELMQRTQDRHSSIRPVQSISNYLESFQHSANYKCNVLEYDDCGTVCTFSSKESRNPQARPTGSSIEGSSSLDGATSGSGQLVGGVAQPVEVWYDSCCYFRVPASISPEVAAGEDVILEAGALLPRQGGGNGAEAVAGGLVRWLVCYSSTGDRRLKWARNELYTAGDLA